MAQLTSRDGTSIAFTASGSGPALILVGGAFNEKASLAPYAEALAHDFTVYNYDRRGRGESGDTQPYAEDREIEDIDALIEAAGGSAFVLGASSGGVLVLDAAAKGLKITKLAVYEPPFVVDDTRPPVPADIVKQLQDLIAAGRRGDAAELFLTKGALMPAEAVAGMRSAPFWAGVEAVAHTLVYEAIVMGDTLFGKPLPIDRWAAITMPALVVDGGASPDFMHNAAKALVQLLPNATYKTLEGQGHDFAPEAIVPLLKEFFLG